MPVKRNRTCISREDHGLSDTPLYEVWAAMKDRCNNPKNKRFARYGGRGIKVSDEWSRSFLRFQQDMGERPSGCTLERKDNDGPYADWNCRWATYQEQARNTGRSRVVTAFGITAPLAAWIEPGNANEYHKIKKRFKRGWAPNLALLGEDLLIAWG
jgi:hypothetical protein